MSIDVTSLPNPKAPSAPNQKPAVPDSNDQKKKVKELQKDQKTVQTIEEKINKSINNINKNMDKSFGKSAKLICLLRLDMVADKLDHINPRLASAVDNIANAFENSGWENEQ